MGRRITVGILPGGVGQLSIDQNTVTTVDTNANLTITADGSGIIQIAKDSTANGNVTLLNQSSLRLRETTANGTNYAGIRAPAALASDYTLTLPNAVAASNGLVLTSDTSGVLTWDAPRPFVYSVVTTSFSALLANAYFVNTTSGGITATLPASPAIGDSIRFFDVARTFQTNALIVNRNGQRIQGDLDNLTVNTQGAAFELIFSNTTFGWRIFSI